MASLFKISVRFLLDEFDGRGDGGEPEWPPSPLRLFQTLTNSAGRLGMATFAPSLKHLEKLPPPTVVASKPAATQPSSSPRYKVTSYVPNNDGDLWFDKPEKSSGKRVEKNIRPTRLPENAVVHYSWILSEEPPAGFSDQMRQLTHAVSAFGWGVNIVVADAVLLEKDTADDFTEATEKWFPAEEGIVALRIPASGTLAALEIRHKAFLTRLPTAPDGSQFFSPVPPLERFHVITYRRESDPIRPPFAIFALRHLDDSGFRSFDPVRRGLHVAAMLRHVAGGPEIAHSLGWDETQIGQVVHGHTDKESTTAPSGRLLFLPLPSIEPRGQGETHVVGAIRRVLITTQGAVKRDEFRRFAQRLDGLELIDAKTGLPATLLSRLPDSERLTRDNYLTLSSAWATVTPVVLPGYDDPRKLRQRLGKESSLTAKEKNALVAKLDQRIDHLLRKALRQAGYSEAIAQQAQIEWRGSGFLPRTDLASRYLAGDQHRRYRKLHVRISFRDAQEKPIEIPGPVCIGGGKYSGTGLFAAID